MSYQAVFKRYEIKYLLTYEEKQKILDAMEPYMKLDKYGRTTIRNIYFDTDKYRLIRRSMEKPAYKEKIRIRSYELATHESQVFVELKKKYNKVVYKRRITMPESVAMSWVSGEIPCPEDTQITREIDYFCKFYGGVKPSVFLSYEREAYFERNGGDFRVTFDDNILCRQTDLSLTYPPSGDGILPEGMVMMEVKCSGGMPMWMVKVLSREKIFKTSFSKYGNAYEKLIFPYLNAENKKEIKTNSIEEAIQNA